MTYLRMSLAAALASAALAGCATFDLSGDAAPLPVRRADNACVRWLAFVDRTVAQTGVADAGAYRIPGFPYLRVDRFIASFAPQALDDREFLAAWLREARALDREGRAIEMQNLPSRDLAQLGAQSREAAVARTEACANELLESDLARPDLGAAVVANARVPDDYVDWNRVVGLYPVARPFFAAGVERWHEEAVEAFREYSDHPLPRVDVVRYAPPASDVHETDRIARLVAGAPRDRFGRIQLGSADLDSLFAAHAPVLEVELSGNFDAIGELAWRSNAYPTVDSARPVVYRRLAFTRYRGEVLPQLVYTAWFSERPPSSSVDVLAGKLDGMVFRVTLARDGTPLVYDSIHPCGCYHMFFPTAQLKALPAPRPGDEWSFAPAPAPAPGPGERIVLHVQSRTHYLTGIRSDSGATGSTYAFADDNSLRSLPLPDGGRRSIYAANGLVNGSERPERWLFWPMGVPSAGTMRQWGHNATAFLGRRHFDDADLIERRFAPSP